MLTLSRKRGERIMIGDSIVIRIQEVRGDKVRIGIEAPKNIAIYREEIYSALKDLQSKEDAEATSSAA
ncbi:carbon storage regulator CsrA [Planctomicrobium sp. SH661]|uniref:carbon storage regulator CsrA n=1 Tax=Planctomicrobium sp. SH661 TaxID=3448124 RepID=UPI003F5CA2C1